MRSKNPEALKNNSTQTPLPVPEVSIPTQNLLGYRGDEIFYKVAVASLPKTYDGNPVPSFNQLDMRPRIQQLAGTEKNSSLFPKEQMTTPPDYDNRPLVERLGGRAYADKPLPLSPLETAKRALVMAEQQRRAS